MKLAILCLLGLGFSCDEEVLIVLADHGRTDYCIVLPAETDVSTKAVARDFAAILKQISGATFPVVVGEEHQTDYMILITEDLTLVPGEYEILTIGKHFVISGGPPRGAINGMYGFLQDHLGCRWFTPGVSRIPKRKRIRLSPIYDRQCPAFRWYSVGSPLHWDGGWTARNRLNECKAFGGSVSEKALMSDLRVKTIGNYYPSHRLTYIPPELHKTHPEYYALIDGERKLEKNKNKRAYCLTNEGFVDYLSKELIKEASKKQMISIGLVDNPKYCRCTKCMASYERVGLAGTYWEFVNKVASKVAKVHPDTIICALAYGTTFKPPSFEIHPNVRVVWCPIGACYAHGLDECKPNRDRGWIDQLRVWKTKTSQLGVWYYHHQGDCLMPHLNLYGTQHSFRAFRDIGVDNVFVQYYVGPTCRTKAVSDGDKLMPAYGEAEYFGYLTVPWGQEHLRAYISSQLLWNPDFDVENGICEFCETYYGSAGEELTQFMLLVESESSYEKTLTKRLQKYKGIHQTGGSSPLPKGSALKEMATLLQEARAKVTGDEVLLKRVRMAELSVQLSILCSPFTDNGWKEAVAKEFFPLIEEMGIKLPYCSTISAEELKALNPKEAQ